VCCSVLQCVALCCSVMQCALFGGDRTYNNYDYQNFQQFIIGVPVDINTSRICRVSRKVRIHICRVSERAHMSPSWLCVVYCNIQKYVTAYIAVRPTVSLSMREQYCSVLQCSCCSVLQCVAVCCSVLTAYIAVRPTVSLSMWDRYCSVLQCSCCSVRGAVFCCVLHCVAAC